MQAEKEKFPLRSHVKHHRSEILRTHENGTKMNFTLQPFAKETLTGPQRAWSSRDNIHTQFCFMKRSDYRQTIDITCKDTEHLAGLHIEMQSKTKWVKIKHVY